MRLSAAFTRRSLTAAAELVAEGAGVTGAGAPSCNVRMADAAGAAALALCVARGGRSIERAERPLLRGDGDEGLTSSSQFNIENFPIHELCGQRLETPSVHARCHLFLLFNCKKIFATVSVAFDLKMHAITDKLRRWGHPHRRT